MATLLTRKTGERLRQFLDATATAKPASQLTPMSRAAPRSHRCRIVMIGGTLRLQVFLSGALWYDQAAVHASTANTEDGDGWYRVADAADGTVWSVLQTSGSTLVCYEASVPAEFRAKLPICIIVDGKIRQLADGVLSGGQLDAKSLDRTTGGLAQFRAFDTAADSAGDFVAATSLFPYKKALDGLIHYITLLTALGAMTAAEWGDLDELLDAVAANLNHSQLHDIAGGTAGDDHTGANFNYLANIGDAGRNSMTADAYLGDDPGVRSISAHLRILYDNAVGTPAGKASLNWLLRQCLGADGATVHLDWLAKELLTAWVAKSTLQVDGKLTAKDDAAVEKNLTVTLTTQTKDLTVTETTQTKDLTVTQAAVTVNGNVYTPRRAADLSPDALVLAYDP